MSMIRPFQPDDLQELTSLVNWHIARLIPEWVLPPELIHSRLSLNPDQYIIDPWVIKRETFCAFSGDKLIGAGHLLRYGTDEKVSENYQNTGDIAWFLFYPEFYAEAYALLQICHRQMRQWQVTRLGAWDSGLPIPATPGIADKWPHLMELFTTAGYQPNPERREAIFGGNLETFRAMPKLQNPETYHYQLVEELHEYALYHENQKIGYCRFDMNLAKERPALKGFGELTDLYINEGWRRQGIGRAFMQLMAEKMLENNIHQIVFSVAIDDEIAGAGTFYNSMGWDALARMEDGWQLTLPFSQ